MKKYRRITSAVTNIIIIVMLISLTVVSFSGQYSSFVSLNANDRPYYKGNPTRGEVALMINVYWGTEYLDDMLKVLDNHNAKCTFFVGGSWASKNSEYLEKMIERGHEIGNHGYFHKDHAKLNYAQNESEIKSNNVLVNGLTGYKMTLFAPPSGSFNDITLKVAADLGMQTIMWSRDTIDWRDKDSSLVFSRATNKVTAGDMILMHPTAHTLAALGEILSFYEENDLTPVTVSQIIKQEII